ncbi:MAG: extracellular solute-binding protein, partial [Patescibacteria group bacterium]|nr:extracellular solute-binding protein [Patescibacteria group bacterium]
MTVENTSLEGQRRAPAGSLPAAPQTAVPVGSNQQAAQTASVPQPPVAPLPLSPRPDDEKGHPSIPFPIKIFIASLIILLVFGSFIFLFSHLMAGGSSKVKLTYWGLWEDSNVMQSVISDFERQNPNITVEYVKQDPKQYSERLLARIQNGTGPDIFRFHNTWVPMLRGVLAPLTRETMTSQDFSKSFFPVAKIDLIKNGAILGIPLEIDTLSLFANTDLLQKEKLSVPTTWPDFISVSRAITTRDINGKIKIAGAALGAYDNITHAPDIVSLLLVQNGANVNDLGSTAQNASDAVTFYTSFTKNDGNVWDTTLDPSIKAF